MVLARGRSTLLLSGILFAALLCLKHIYLYLAPAYFVFLLRAYCLGSRSTFPYFNVRFLNCIKLSVGIVAIFAAAFGPFALWGQLEQVFRRLFPFSRGLCHAYWAPNVWAMYSFSDRVLIYCESPSTSAEISANSSSGATSRTTSRSRRGEQRHSRACWRHILRCASGYCTVDMLLTHLGYSDCKHVHSKRRFRTR